ncbi:MAG: hypothetical protein WC010_03415 [Candidatus Absconditabacterales bacterium]
MKLYQHIAHHVHKHKEKIIAHVQKHHTKYLVGAGMVSGMAITKIIGVLLMFFGMTYMGGGTIGADYYDAEYYTQEAAKEISIGNNKNTENISITTGCTVTSGNLPGTTGNCPSTNK